jgi:hypothetical protein
MYENRIFKRDAFIKVTRRRFRDERSETRASFTNPVGNTTIKIVVQYPTTVAAACNILYVDDVELIKEETLDHFTPGGSGSATYGWTGSNTLTTAAINANALRVTNNTVQEGFKRNITLAAKKYTFSFFMDKGLEDLNDKEYFSVDIINSSNAIVYTYTTKVNATGYYNFDYSATTAGTYTWRFRRVSLNGRSTAGTAYFDDFKVSSTIQQSQQVCSSPKNYRFGFNTQEKDDEVYGAGNLNTAEFWEYDTRLGRRWNLDQVVKVWESPYLVNSGNPIRYLDPKGDDWVEGKNGDIKWKKNVTSATDKDLKDYETYRGKTYARSATWNNKFAKGKGVEVYSDDIKVKFYPANKDGMLQLPQDDNNVNSKFTAGSQLVYTVFNRNDENIRGKVETDGFGSTSNIATFINIAVGYKSETGGTLSYGDLSTSNGGSPMFWDSKKGDYRPHKSHFSGSQIDIRYMDGKGNPIVGLGNASANKASVKHVQSLLNNAWWFGANFVVLGNSLNGKVSLLDGKTSFNSEHNNHIHLGIK